MLREELKKYVGILIELINSYPIFSSILFISVGIYILIFKVPKVKPFFKEKDAGYYRELFIYFGITFLLFTYAFFLILHQLYPR